MDFVCPTCKQRMPRELQIVISHTDQHIVEIIKKQHPDWVEQDGICRKCYDYYKKQLHPDAG